MEIDMPYTKLDIVFILFSLISANW